MGVEMASCRECTVCTRVGVLTLLLLVPNIFYAVVIKWWFRAFSKMCPHCGHPLSKHLKRADGSFID